MVAAAAAVAAVVVVGSSPRSSLQLSYKDNRPTLEMIIRKPIGLFTLLNEESKLQSSTERSLLQKLGSHLAGDTCDGVV
jgi:hypothetical protein